MVVLNTVGLVLLSLLLLFLLLIIYYIGQYMGKAQKEREWQEKLLGLRGDIADKQRAGIKGKVTEMFAPYLEGFPMKASECKFLGDPIDYIAFEGLDERNVKAIHFIDVKADSSELSKHQKQIKEIVEGAHSSQMQFHTFHFKTSKNADGKGGSGKL